MLVWILVGIIGISIGLVIFNQTKKKAFIDIKTKKDFKLPEDVSIEKFQCQDCGADLTIENIIITAGAQMVKCPYCDASYHLIKK